MSCIGLGLILLCEEYSHLPQSEIELLLGLHQNHVIEASRQGQIVTSDYDNATVGPVRIVTLADRSKTCIQVKEMD